MRLSKVDELGQASLHFTNRMQFTDSDYQRLMSNSTFEESLADPIYKFQLVLGEDEKIEDIKGWRVSKVTDT